MTLIIAGDRSGVGKTTITLAILAWLKEQGKAVQSFKVGPDYIDPMFHTLTTGIPCRNLDPILTSEVYVQNCYQLHSQKAQYGVIEGVMGLFDGIGYLDARSTHLNDRGSTAHMARLLNLPVALVLDCSRLSSSVAAIASGYARLDPQVKIAGIILNQVASDRHLELLSTALETIAMPILGVFRRDRDFQIPDRHLGLVPSGELTNIQQILAKLAHIADLSLDWKQLLPLMAIQTVKINQKGRDVTGSRDVTCNVSTGVNLTTEKIRIGVARDRAFNFYYQDNLELLEQLGAELVFWSPMAEAQIPPDLQGLYFGGGFPEMFAQELAINQGVLQHLRKLITAGMPTYAECGGLMYLCQQLIDLEGKTYPMVGVLPSTVTMQARLTLGYRQGVALEASSAIATGQTVVGHEFHRSQLVNEPVNPLWQLQGFHRSSLATPEGWQIDNIHASYLHLHWGDHPEIPQRWLNCCRQWHPVTA